MTVNQYSKHSPRSTATPSLKKPPPAASSAPPRPTVHFRNVVEAVPFRNVTTDNASPPHLTQPDLARVTQKESTLPVRGPFPNKMEQYNQKPKPRYNNPYKQPVEFQQQNASSSTSNNGGSSSDRLTQKENTSPKYRADV
eukprot:Sro90_g047370.1 n/a (140) ;mRNA; r:55869-56288